MELLTSPIHISNDIANQPTHSLVKNLTGVINLSSVTNNHQQFILKTFLHLYKKEFVVTIQKEQSNLDSSGLEIAFSKSLIVPNLQKMQMVRLNIHLHIKTCHYTALC